MPPVSDQGVGTPAAHHQTGANLMLRIKCQHCAVRSTGPCGMLSDGTANELGRIVHRRRMPAGQIVYSGTQRAKSFAIIVSGVVKLINVKPDGRNQIVGLQFASEFVGRPFSDTTTLIAEAATDLDVCSFSGRTFEGLMETYPDLERAILRRTLDDLDAAREWMFMIARKTAEERVASLLLLMARKMRDRHEPESQNGEATEIDLPLSRTEIAECLGLRLETVSRQIAQLKALEVIATGRRRALKICDLAELTRRSEKPSE